MADDIPTVLAPDVPDDAYILDVREPNEWAAGHVTGATHIPLGELKQRISELPASEPLVVMCKVGGRSAMATSFLQSQGYQATNLGGGIQAWVDAGRPIVTPDGSTGTVVPPSTPPGSIA